MIPEGWKLVPMVPTVEMLAVIRNEQYPEDWERGKVLQRRLGLDVVPPETNIEIAAGQYERLLQRAPEAPTPANAPTIDRVALETALEALTSWQPSYERPSSREVVERLYECRNAARDNLKAVLKALPR